MMPIYILLFLTVLSIPLSALAQSPGSFTTLTASGATTLGSTLGVTGTTTLSGNVNATAGSLLLGTGAGSTAGMSLITASGNRRVLYYMSGGGGASNLRWRNGANNTAETGSDVGSDFEFTAWSDSGSAIGTPLLLKRSNMQATFAGVVQGNAGIYLPMTVTAPASGPLLAAGTAPLFVSETLSGTIASGQQAFANGITLLDTLDARPAPDNAGRAFRISHNLNNGFGGGRASLDVLLNVQGTTINTDPRHSQWGAAMLAAVGAVNVGGTGTGSGQSRGAVYGINPIARLDSGATNWYAVAGGEVNIGMADGASASGKRGFYVATLATDRGQGANEDFAFGISTLGSTVGWRLGYSVGQVSGTTGFAIDPDDGALFGIQTMLYNAPGGPQFARQTSKYGINLSEWLPVDSALLSPGLRIDGSGSVYVGGGKLSYSSPTFSIDAPGRVVTAATVDGTGVPNTGNYVGDLLYERTYHGIYEVATVNGSGGVTSVTVLRPSFTTDGSPATNLTMVGGSGGGQGIKLNVTWTAATTVAIGANTNTRIGSGSALSLGATVGFLQIPTMAGTPTGTVGAAGQAAVVYNTSANKLCVSVGGGTWRDAVGGTC